MIRKKSLFRVGVAEVILGPILFIFGKGDGVENKLLGTGFFLAGLFSIWNSVTAFPKENVESEVSKK